MQQRSLPTRPPRPIGWSGAAAVLAGAAMGAPVGLRVACHLSSWLPGPYGCVPGGAPAGALVGALLALVALPLLHEGTRRREPAVHRPAATTATAARLLRRGWARWAAVVACSLLGVAALAGLGDWIRALMRSRANGWTVTADRVAVDLITPVLFLAISVGVVVLLMTPASRRDFRSSSQLPAGTNGR